MIVVQNLAKKQYFTEIFQKFAKGLAKLISTDDEWAVKGFIDVFGNIYTISQDTKVISKILELQLFPFLLSFADEHNYEIEVATHQNWYPDLTFINKTDRRIKFAVDIKTTYRLENNPEFCNGFTLGSHGEYFINRNSTKNIQYPYKEYCGHFCLGIIYSRAELEKIYQLSKYNINQLKDIPSVINTFTFFAEEKWKIASDKCGSGNTANIGSIKRIDDILNGRGVFLKYGEHIFDDYWVNYGKIQIPTGGGGYKPMRSFADYLSYKGLPEDFND